MTLVQNQCAPDGFAGSSVSRLIATRSRAGGGDPIRAAASLRCAADAGRSVVAIAQNTLDETAAGLIRDWRMYWARACMTPWWTSSITP
jgi:hypothetical protein